MNTLVVAPFSPYPLIFGGAIRLYHVVKMFSLLSDVTLLAYRSYSGPEGPIGDLDTICKEVIIVDRPPSHTRKKAALQVKSLFSTRSFQYYSTYSPHFQHELDALLARRHFECIVTDFSQMGYFRYRHDRALRILDLHNIEHELLYRRAQVEQNPIKKAALALEAWKFRRDEIAIAMQHDLVLTASERERDQLREQVTTVAVEALPNSIDADYFALRPSTPSTNEITFVGTTHVDANRDGLCYFMDEIFPLLEQRVPDIHFTIVGGEPPASIRAFGRRHNVEVTGGVPDVRPYMARAKVLVVPLRVGGGTRLKVLEGLAYGVPTVSTRLGSEGINVEDGRHILLADEPGEFCEKVVRALRDTELQALLINNGRQLVERQYSWQAVGKHLARYLDAAFLRRQGLRAAA